ncbi:MAG: A/G-specific adenine glycosylase [Acidimicrobiales bacterium]
MRADRDRLPWRLAGADPGPFGVLVSEVMLAQTQAGRVAERYPEFMERFPTPAALAGASLGEVLRVWQGLGYPRRAANLHRCAGAIVERHGGTVPADLPALLALPGVGPYTARAVLAFAFDEATMPVDTNIGRVLARFAGRSLGAKQVQSIGDDVLAETAAAGGSSGAVALAYMDLGATVCRPKSPRCGDCPLLSGCIWGRARLAAGEHGPTPDPARGSARVSTTQARFEGSDRQGRGRLLRAAGDGPVSADGLAAAAGWPADPSRAARVAATLVSDGLLTIDDAGSYVLGSGPAPAPTHPFLPTTDKRASIVSPRSKRSPP